MSAHNTNYANRKILCCQRFRHYKTKDDKTEIMTTADTEVYNNKVFAHVIYKIQKK